MRPGLIPIIASFAALGPLAAGGAALAQVPEGRFEATIYIDDDEAGRAVFTREDQGAVRIDQLDSKVSVSLLGLELFGFTQTVREAWRGEELQAFQSVTNDDGEVYDIALERENGVLKGTLNDQPVELPAGAFPTSVWHYDIVNQNLLFDVKDLDVREVQVERSTETLEIDGQRIPTERFTFTEGWNATIWYDSERRLVQFTYPEGSYEVKIVAER